MNELLVKIKFLLPSLPRAERDFAKALLESPEAIVEMTLAVAARESGSSEASIIRFCKRLGLDGYSALKKSFEKALDDEVYQAESVDQNDDIHSILQKVYNSNVQTLQNTMVLSNDGYEQAVDALVHAKSVHFFGVGDANAACQFTYIKYTKLGIPCSAHSDVMMQYIVAENMGPGDVAIAVSYEGRSRNVNQALKIAKENGATTICITRRNKSPMLKYVDIPLFVSVSDLSIGWETATRRLAEQFVLDVLYVGFRAKTKKQYEGKLKKVQVAIDLNKQ